MIIPFPDRIGTTSVARATLIARINEHNGTIFTAPRHKHAMAMWRHVSKAELLERITDDVDVSVSRRGHLIISGSLHQEHVRPPKVDHPVVKIIREHVGKIFVLTQGQKSPAEKEALLSYFHDFVDDDDAVEALLDFDGNLVIAGSF